MLSDPSTIVRCGISVYQNNAATQSLLPEVPSVKKGLLYGARISGYFLHV